MQQRTPEQYAGDVIDAAEMEAKAAVIADEALAGRKSLDVGARETERLIETARALTQGCRRVDRDDNYQTATVRGKLRRAQLSLLAFVENAEDDGGLLPADFKATRLRELHDECERLEDLLREIDPD